MMAPRFADELAAHLSTEGMVYPEGFGDAISGAYNDDMAEAIAEANAASNTIIAEREQRIQDLMAQQAIPEIPEEAKESYDDDDELDANFDDFFTEDPDEDADK